MLLWRAAPHFILWQKLGTRCHLEAEVSITQAYAMKCLPETQIVPAKEKSRLQEFPPSYRALLFSANYGSLIRRYCAVQAYQSFAS